MNIFLLCTAILILLYTWLAMNVSGLRMQKRRNLDLSDDTLKKAIRAHGNAAEYIPVFLAAFLYFTAIGYDNPWAIAAAIVATVSRILHATGMLLLAKPGDRHPLRFLGAMGTYAALVTLGIIFVVQVF